MTPIYENPQKYRIRRLPVFLDKGRDALFAQFTFLSGDEETNRYRVIYAIHILIRHFMRSKQTQGHVGPRTELNRPFRDA
jgi:hypothetical protein